MSDDKQTAGMTASATSTGDLLTGNELSGVGHFHPNVQLPIRAGQVLTSRARSGQPISQ